MALFMIATIHDNNEMIGVRLLDTNSKQIKDVPIREVITAIEKGITIQNIDVEQGQLVGTNGSLDRYTKIDRFCNVLNFRAFVILNKTDKGKFTVADYMGNIMKVTFEKLYATVYRNMSLRLANGKLVNGVISAIKGEYETIAENKKKVGNKLKYIDLAELTDVVAVKMNIENKKEALRKVLEELRDMPKDMTVDESKLKFSKIRVSDKQGKVYEGLPLKEYEPTSWKDEYVYHLLDISGNLTIATIKREELALRQFVEITDKRYKEFLMKYIEKLIAKAIRGIPVSEAMSRATRIVDEYEAEYKKALNEFKNSKGLLSAAQFKELILTKANIPYGYDLEVKQNRVELTLYGDYEKYVADKVSFTYMEYDHTVHMRDIEELTDKEKEEYIRWLKKLSARGKVTFRNCNSDIEYLEIGDKYSLQYVHSVVFHLKKEYTKEEAERITDLINKR